MLIKFKISLNIKLKLLNILILTNYLNWNYIRKFLKIKKTKIFFEKVTVKLLIYWLIFKNIKDIKKRMNIFLS